MAAVMICVEDSNGCVDDGGDASFGAGIELTYFHVPQQKRPIGMYTWQYLYRNGSDITWILQNLLLIIQKQGQTR